MSHVQTFPSFPLSYVFFAQNMFLWRKKLYKLLERYKTFLPSVWESVCVRAECFIAEEKTKRRVRQWPDGRKTKVSVIVFSVLVKMNPSARSVTIPLNQLVSWMANPIQLRMIKG